MRRAVRMILATLACGLVAWSSPANAGPRILRAGNDFGGGSGIDVNLIVREVRVSPIRAHVGDTIRVDMLVENVGDVMSDTAIAEILANGKVVVSGPFAYGYGGEGERLRRVTLTWNTSGAKPGNYRIRGQFYVWGDTSPFDNYLDAAKPLELVAAGAAFPNGEKAGGVGVGRDPRYRPAHDPLAEGEARP